MSGYIHKSSNKSLLLYHFVCPIKYRRNVLTERISITLYIFASEAIAQSSQIIYKTDLST